MAKLHELLAVEGNLKGQAEKCRSEQANAFRQKQHLFEEKLATFSPSGEGETTIEEQLSLQTTVMGELHWVAGHMTRAIDASLQVALTNQIATADVVLDDGTTLLAGIPATSLLELEKRLKEIQDLITAAPTLDPAKGFAPDPARGDYIYKSRDEVRVRTKKTKKVIVKYPATEQHPAQTDMIDVDEPIGTIRTTYWSGRLTPAHKAELLDRCEALTRAVKSARARANEAKVVDAHAGDAIFRFILK